MDQTQEVQTQGGRQTTEQPAGPTHQPLALFHYQYFKYSGVITEVLSKCVCLHATKLEAVSVGLVMGSQVVVVKHPNAEHCGVDAGAQEEDGDEARHLVGRSNSKQTG